MQEESSIKRNNPSDILRYDRRSKNYFYTGNIIANALEIDNYAENQLFEDIFTIAGEDAIRENFGYYFYDRQYTDLPRIQEQLERAIDPNNPQIPPYEIPRNHQNFINNVHLVNARFDENSPFNNQPFLEISPPPSAEDVFLQEQIKERGYTRFSYLLVSVPTIDDNGNKIERGVQLWLDKLDESNWYELFRGLKLLADIEAAEVAGFSNGYSPFIEQYGADIISKGGFMNAAQFAFLKNFLAVNEIEAKFDDLENVALIQKNFRIIIEQRMGSQIRDIINKSQNISRFEEIEMDLSELSSKLIALNNEIKLFIRDMFDKPLAHSDYSQTYASFNQLSDQERYRIVQEGGYEIKFCGGNQKGFNTVLGKVISTGGERVFGLKSPITPDLSEPCPHCGARWWIKEGDTNTYESICPNSECRKSVYC